MKFFSKIEEAINKYGGTIYDTIDLRVSYFFNRDIVVESMQVLIYTENSQDTIKYLEDTIKVLGVWEF